MAYYGDKMLTDEEWEAEQAHLEELRKHKFKEINIEGKSLQECGICSCIVIDRDLHRSKCRPA